MQFLIAHIGHTGKHCEHVTWWRPDCAGYTTCIDKAGRYDEAKARDICQYGGSIAVPIPAAEALARSTPYYRRHDGRLAGLYDGASHRPVENKAEEWKRLMANRLACAKVMQKPTPMSDSKARAIYLDPAPPVPATTEQAAGDEEQAVKERK